MDFWVHNLSGTSKDKYGKTKDNSKNWKEFWEKHKNKKFDLCANKNCNRGHNGNRAKATDGGHVQKVSLEPNQLEQSWYIVPLCSTCNHPEKKDSFIVSEADMQKVNLES